MAGCSPRIGGEIDAGAVGGEVTLSSLELEIFTPSCALTSCHAPNPPPQAPMSLEQGKSYEALVGASSSQVPTLLRVAPGNPANSYLIHKLRGTAATVGGAATQMPSGRGALPEEQVARIEAWIRKGAPND